VTSAIYGFSKFLCWLFLRLGFGLQVEGQARVPRAGGCVIASNHVSFLDPIVVGVACPRRLTFMARSSLFTRPFLGWWLRGVGAIPVTRDEADLPAVRAALQALRGGQPMALFPEGTRQPDGRLGAARRGIGLLACGAAVPVVPLYLHGTHAALPRGARWFRRAKIRVAFGAPIPYTTPSAPTENAPAAASGVSTSQQSTPPGGAEGSPGHLAASHGGAPSRAEHERVAQAVTAAWHELAARRAVADP